MLTNCDHCVNGLLLPMLDSSNVYHGGVSLYLHQVPYMVCTHCNARKYPSLEAHSDLAKKIYDKSGITSFKYDPFGIIPENAEAPGTVKCLSFEPAFFKKIIFCLGAAAVLAMINVFFQKKQTSIARRPTK